jgi:hypothetical protein
MTELDHITVAASSLAQGVAHVQAALGIAIPYGGAHPRMATHNHLVRLGDSLFLEVIAIDPAATPPSRPRWFGLDDPALQAELALAPRLVTWVVRTTQIAEVVRASRPPLGAIEPMQRGELRWRITIAADGSLVDGGMVPSVIQWPAGAHPATRMPDLGCALVRLEAVHPDPDAYRRDLASIGADRHVEISAGAPGRRAYLVAKVRTPDGVRELR